MSGAADLPAILAAVERARNLALAAQDAVIAKGCPWLASSSECAGWRWSADQNLRDLELLPEILEGALRDRPSEREATLAQARVVLDQTEERTRAIASWAERDDLAAMVRAIWDEIRRLLGLVAGAAAGLGLLLLGLAALYWLGGRR